MQAVERPVREVAVLGDAGGNPRVGDLQHDGRRTAREEDALARDLLHPHGPKSTRDTTSGTTCG